MYKKYIKEYKNYPIDGVNYIDVNPLYQNVKLRTNLVNDCLKKIKKIDFDYIGIVESRGFIIGSIIAHELNKSVVLLRSKRWVSEEWGERSRLTGKTHTIKRDVQYGESIVQVQEGEGKVLIFDDVLASGGTAEDCIDVLWKAGYTPVFALFLVELDFLNSKLHIPHESIIHYNEGEIFK